MRNYMLWLLILLVEALVLAQQTCSVVEFMKDDQDLVEYTEFVALLERVSELDITIANYLVDGYDGQLLVPRNNVVEKFYDQLLDEDLVEVLKTHIIPAELNVDSIGPNEQNLGGSYLLLVSDELITSEDGRITPVEVTIRKTLPCGQELSFWIMYGMFLPPGMQQPKATSTSTAQPPAPAPVAAPVPSPGLQPVLSPVEGNDSMSTQMLQNEDCADVILPGTQDCQVVAQSQLCAVESVRGIYCTRSCGYCTVNNSSTGKNQLLYTGAVDSPIQREGDNTQMSLPTTITQTQSLPSSPPPLPSLQPSPQTSNSTQIPAQQSYSLNQPGTSSLSSQITTEDQQATPDIELLHQDTGYDQNTADQNVSQYLTYQDDLAFQVARAPADPFSQNYNLNPQEECVLFDDYFGQDSMWEKYYEFGQQLEEWPEREMNATILLPKYSGYLFDMGISQIQDASFLSPEGVEELTRIISANQVIGHQVRFPNIQDLGQDGYVLPRSNWKIVYEFQQVVIINLSSVFERFLVLEQNKRICDYGWVVHVIDGFFTE